MFGHYVHHPSWHDHSISPQLTPFRTQLAPENIFNPRAHLSVASSDEDCESGAEEGEDEMSEGTGNFDGNKEFSRQREKNQLPIKINLAQALK